MKRYVLPIIASLSLSACGSVGHMKAGPYTTFEPTEAAYDGQPILPDGVAVLYDYPACDFEELGQVKVTNYQIDITPSRIEALKQQAALYGADAIIVHPNLPVCNDGSHPPICGGRGEYVIATAIHYLDEPLSLEPEPVLEYESKSRYDRPEFYHPNDKI